MTTVLTNCVLVRHSEHLIVTVSLTCAGLSAILHMCEQKITILSCHEPHSVWLMAVVDQDQSLAFTDSYSYYYWAITHTHNCFTALL